MIKTNKNINYGAALTSLLEGLKFAEEMAKSKEEYKYPNAYGRATMAIKMCLMTCTDMQLSDIEKATNPKPPANGYYEAPTLLLHKQLNWEDEGDRNDIPAELYSSPKN